MLTGQMWKLMWEQQVMDSPCIPPRGSALQPQAGEGEEFPTPQLEHLALASEPWEENLVQCKLSETWLWTPP